MGKRTELDNVRIFFKVLPKGDYVFYILTKIAVEF